MKRLLFSLLLYTYQGFGHALTPLFSLRGLVPARKGFLPSTEIWMHAASVGEAGVATAIISALKKIRPRSRILLTLQTQTGLKQAQRLLRGFTEIEIKLAPFDLPLFVRRALKSARPSALVLIETELWPTLLFEAQRQKIPIVLVNGRLSARSYPRYRYLRPLFRPLLQKFYALGVIGPLEARRFISLGAPEEKIKILGNAKYDLILKRAQKLSIHRIQKKLDPKRTWLVFGSVRRGEEGPLSRIVPLLQREFPELGFLFAPRHLETAPLYLEALKREGLSPVLWSQASGQEGIVVLDEIGPLFETYARAKVAFIGGSLVPKGGQNPLEPAAFKVPVIFGPYMENFPYEAEELLLTGGGIRIHQEEELLRALRHWLVHEEERSQAGMAAFRVLQEFSQAAERYAELIILALNLLPL